MNIIKLDAIGSTNVYLKNLLANLNLENFTVVVADNQTAGKGQRGALWTSEPSSNLTFSVLVKDLLLGIESIYDLNVAVSLSVFNAIKNLGIEGLSIKWPNDILADNKKIGGILIENIIKSNGEIFSVVGIGINVNQGNFGELAQATSLVNVFGKEFDREILMNGVLKQLQYYFNSLRNDHKIGVWQEYHNNLYRISIPSAFELPSGERFMGIIQNVSQQGTLVVLLESGKIEEFYIKEVKMLY